MVVCEFISGGGSEIQTRGTFRFVSLAKKCLKSLGHPTTMEEEVGFEPTAPFETSVFKTDALNHALPLFH